MRPSRAPHPYDHDADPVRAAFEAVPRTGFLPADQVGHAALDRALPIGFGQTNSQPRTVANMLHLLDVGPGQRVLDVGSGSGWSSALLGHLVGSEGAVLAVELVPELVERSRRNLEPFAMAWVHVHQADPAQLGLPAYAPYDRILVSAEAAVLPTPLVEQLRDGGLMVVPVRGRMLSVLRRAAGDLDVHRHGHYQFVPLR